MPRCHEILPRGASLNEQVTLFFRNYHLKRAEKGIRVRGLALFDSKKLVNSIFKDIEHTDIRFISEFTPSGVVIYGSKVITLDWENVPTAFVIESKAVASSYRKSFEEKWGWGSSLVF